MDAQGFSEWHLQAIFIPNHLFISSEDRKDGKSHEESHQLLHWL